MRTSIPEQPPTFAPLEPPGLRAEYGCDSAAKMRVSRARPRRREAPNACEPRAPGTPPGQARKAACEAVDRMWAARPLSPPSRKRPEVATATAGERALVHDIRVGAWIP